VGLAPLTMFTRSSSEGYVAALPGIARRTLCHGANTLLTEFRLRGGCTLPAHRHPQEQTGYLVSGHLSLRIGDTEHDVRPGDSWCIASNVEHQAVILEDSVALEVFAPVREDYLPPAAPPEPVVGLAHPADAEEILALQKLAYRREAELHDDWTIPPLVETVDAMRAAILQQIVFKATLAGRILGAVRGRLDDETCHVGRLIVQPEFQRRGLGARLVQALEAHATAARRFELFTGSRSAGNIRLYERLGYRQFRTAPISPKVTLVYLEKRRPPAAGDRAD